MEWIDFVEQQPEPYQFITFITRHGDVISGITDSEGWLDTYDGTSVDLTQGTHWVALPPLPE